MESQDLAQYGKKLLENIESLIVNTRNRVAVSLNAETTLLYWSIGNYINEEIRYEAYTQYGNKILVTLSQELTKKFGKGYSYSAITRMIKIASVYDKETIATLSQQLSWSHFIELAAIENPTKRLFYHRKLNCLVAIELKLGKFKPEYKAKMELYLRYLQKYEQQDHENSPIGLLLYSEGNTEHVELLMLDEKNIRVAQYLTGFPDKQWFIDKLHKAISLAQQNRDKK